VNIIEAIKSGKRFRRKSWTSPKNWLTEKGELALNHWLDLPVDSIIADDWEVESEPVLITRERFDAASNAVSDKLYRPNGWPVHITDFLEELKKELGI
jgi:hypothetical protein